MNLLRTLLLLFYSLTTFAQDSESRVKNLNLEDGVALQGYDPMSYFSGMPEEGKKEFKASYQGVTYYFLNSVNRQKFLTSPELYEPAYGGWCAFAMGESGEKVKVDPETFKIIDKKVYLFYNFWGNNTLKEWNKTETKLKSSADDHWKKYSKP